MTPVYDHSVVKLSLIVDGIVVVWYMGIARPCRGRGARRASRAISARAPLLLGPNTRRRLVWRFICLLRFGYPHDIDSTVRRHDGFQASAVPFRTFQNDHTRRVHWDAAKNLKCSVIRHICKLNAVNRQKYIPYPNQPRILRNPSGYQIRNQNRRVALSLTHQESETMRRSLH